MTWTFDPLVRRNAWFNISVLGATIDDYLVDFYGQMHDSINGNDPTDRLLVAWSTRGPHAPTTKPCRRVRSPCRRPTTSSCCAAPTRRPRPTWRLRLREELGGPLTSGATVVGFTRDGEYVVAPTPTDD